MFAFAYLYVSVCLALLAVASPLVSRKSPVTIPIARRFNGSGLKTILERDQSRAKVFKQGANSGIMNAFDNNTGTAYTTQVQVGSPPKTFTLLVDTGSSNTWVGAQVNNPYIITSTSRPTGNIVTVIYGSGEFAGTEWTDTLAVGGLEISQQSIGVAGPGTSIGFNGIDGILGIGPTDLTANTTLPSGKQIPTVTDNAYSQGIISHKQVGISFQPTNSESDANGELTFGGPDQSKFIGDLDFVPITSTSPASKYVGIDQNITYGGSRVPILSRTAGIVDTGTTLLLLASDAYGTYVNATGATPDNTTGLLSISAANYAKLESLFFNIGGNSYEFTANAQTFPRSLNTAIGGNASSIYLIVGDLQSPSGEGLDFIMGYTFLERYYHVYDSGNNQAGFAATPYTFATTN